MGMHCTPAPGPCSTPDFLDQRVPVSKNPQIRPKNCGEVPDLTDFCILRAKRIRKFLFLILDFKAELFEAFEHP